VLDTASVQAFGGGKHLFPAMPPLDLPAARQKAIEAIIKDVFKEDIATLAAKHDSQLRTVKVATALELCRHFDSEDWDGDAIANVLSAVSENECNLVFRRMDRKRRPGQGPELPTGAISGDELETARGAGRPTFFILKQMREEDGAWARKRFLYPTLVFHSTMPNVVFNATSA
jgi:hypothetical protein